MVSEIFFENKKYFSVKDASSLTGYSKDYIGQLCRSNKIISRRIGRVWYVEEDSLLNYKNTPTTFDFSKNLYSKKEVAIDTVPAVVNVVIPAVVAEEVIAETLPVSLREEVVVSETKVPEKVEGTSKLKFAHELIFAFDTNVSRKFVPALVVILMIIGAFSLKNSFSSFVKTTAMVANFISGDTNTFSSISQKISDSPKNVYFAFNDILGLYSENLNSIYNNLGQKTLIAGKVLRLTEKTIY